MTINIQFRDSLSFKFGGNPRQYRHVRMATVYTEPDHEANPELVIHFYDEIYPQVSINLSEIASITTTNE